MTIATIEQARQYRSECGEFGNLIFLMRIGDFYETFDDDARTAAKILGLTITTRCEPGEAPVPMAGFPCHQLQGYLAKIVAAGYRAAVCEPAPRNAKDARRVARRLR